jgi:hypothetical protein
MSALDRFLMPATPALRLATLRVLVGTYGLIYLLVRLPHLLSYALTDATRFVPVGPVSLLSSPLPPDIHRALVALTLITSLTFALGLHHRVLAPLHGLLLTWVLSYTNSWGMILHTDNLYLAHVLVLACSPAADALSLDARGQAPVAPHPRYGWAPRLMVALAAATYLLAGIAKLRNGGLHFIEGDTLRNLVAFDNARKIELGDMHSPLGVLLLDHPRFFATMAAGSLLLELGAPLALFRRIGRPWAIAMWSFHVGVLLLMAIGFVYPLTFVAFVAFFDVERLWPRRPLRALANKLGLGLAD